MLNEFKLLSSSIDYSIKIWDLSEKCLTTMYDNTLNVICIIKLNENSFASASTNILVIIWDLISKSCLKYLRGHTGSVRIIIKLNKKLLASGSLDHTIRIWDYSIEVVLKLYQLIQSLL